MEVGILGGGLAGIIMGQILSEHTDYSIQIIEKEKKIGGLARSIQIEGYTFDYGSHIIFSRDDKILSWMLSFLDSNIQKNRRNTAIYYKGHFIKYPFENDLFSLPVKDRYECLLGYVKALINKEKGQDSPKNFEEWILQTFGEGIAKHYLIPYNIKVWNYHPNQMSAHWVVDRIPMPPPEDVIKSALGIPTEGYTHQLNFYYPKMGGIESFPRSIQKESKADAITEETIIEIRKENSGWIVITDKEKYNFDLIINNTPIYNMAKTLVGLPEKIKDTIYSLKSNSIWLVLIGVNEPSISKYSWLYFPHNENGPFNRISFPKNFSPNNSPKNKSSILVEITCKKEDKLCNMDKDKIIELTVEYLIKDNIIPSKSIIDFTEALFVPLAYVIYDLDYLKNHKIVYEYFNKIGIINIGRFAEFKYYNMDGIVKSAFEKSKNILKQ